MDRAGKARIVEELRELRDRAVALVVASFDGITVEEVTELRKQIRESNGGYRVVKNTLARIAFEDERYDDLRTHFTGMNAIAYTEEDPVGLMKALVDFAKKSKKLEIKGGFYDGRCLDGEEVKRMAAMPSKEELQAMLVGVLQSPMRKLVNVLSAPMRNLAVVLKAVADEKGKEA